jgi:hypothetical protein
MGRFGRGLGVAAIALAVAGGAAACAKTVDGSASAQPGAKVTTAPSSGPQQPSGSQQPSDSQPPSSDDLSQAAQQACSSLPKDAVTSSFGVTGVSITADSGTTLQGGIKQIKCVITAQGGFRANVVVQVYPPQLITTADQYVTILKREFPNVKTMSVPGADVGGTFQQTVQGNLVDEGFAAKQDPSSNSVEVLLAGIADGPGVQPKLISFVDALAKT